MPCKVNIDIAAKFKVLNNHVYIDIFLFLEIVDHVIYAYHAYHYVSQFASTFLRPSREVTVDLSRLPSAAARRQ